MPFLKRLKRFVIFHDWVWSVISAFLIYWFLNYGPATLGGVAMEYYAINWIQALLATFGIMAGIFTIARLGTWFNLRKIHDYLWGKRYTKEGYMLFSFEDFKNLQPWQKILFASLWLVFLFSAALVVFLRLLSMGGATQ